MYSRSGAVHVANLAALHTMGTDTATETEMDMDTDTDKNKEKNKDKNKDMDMDMDMEVTWTIFSSTKKLVLESPALCARCYKIMSI
jgi:hypothetical protein